MTATTVDPGATAATMETYGPSKARTRLSPEHSRLLQASGVRVFLGQGSTAATVQHIGEMFLREPPAQTLAGAVAQLESGYRLAFTPELRQLAQRAVARWRAGPEPFDALAKRLAREAAELAD